MVSGLLRVCHSTGGPVVCSPEDIEPGVFAAARPTSETRKYVNCCVHAGSLPGHFQPVEYYEFVFAISQRKESKQLLRCRMAQVCEWLDVLIAVLSLVAALLRLWPG